MQVMETRVLAEREAVETTAASLKREARGLIGKRRGILNVDWIRYDPKASNSTSEGLTDDQKEERETGADDRARTRSEC